MREGGQHLALLVLSAHGLRKERTQLGVDAMRPWLRSVIQASKLACATLTCTLLRRPHGPLPAPSPSWRKRQPYGSTMAIQVWPRYSP